LFGELFDVGKLFGEVFDVGELFGEVKEGSLEKSRESPDTLLLPELQDFI
jgi:hypothetical protein